MGVVLDRLPPGERLKIARFYFYWGFALLPVVWAINVFWFYHQIFKRPSFPEQQQIRKYWIGSLIGCISMSIVFIAWIVVFQTQRVAWKMFADRMSLIIPFGSP